MDTLHVIYWAALVALYTAYTFSGNDRPKH